MASFWLHQDTAAVCVPLAEDEDGVTVYVIEVRVADVVWRVRHRYSDFHELHQRLAVEHGLARDALPPKRALNNRCPQFIERRRAGLEQYLRHALTYLQRTMPRAFQHFLGLHQYDVFFLLQRLAHRLYSEGDAILRTAERALQLDVLELHAISVCFDSPAPGGSWHGDEPSRDPSHVLDVCSQLHELRVRGLAAPLGSSNIEPGALALRLAAFSQLRRLELRAVRLDSVRCVGGLRRTLRHLAAHDCLVSSIAHVLMCDVVHKDCPTDAHVWRHVDSLDLSGNRLGRIEPAIALAPNVSQLNLSRNEIREVEQLSGLARLCHVNLSANAISQCEQLHTRLGNVVSLDLSQNGLSSLRGFQRLYSLQSLDVSCNCVADLHEVRHIGQLPCLEHVRLTGNPLAVIVDYRVKVLQFFGSRASEIYLDNEKSTQKEIDTAYVLQALRIVKEGKTPNLNQKFQ